MEGKKIILAVTGSIAAYKAAALVRLLVKAGSEVKVLMTPSATAFISPLTLSTLSKNPVHTDVIDGDAWNNHVELGLWADAMLVAPVTATTLGKMANGISDNIVTAVYLSAKCPVFFAPAMDRDMWLHPATQNNISLLQEYGNRLIDAVDGELASGLIGKGRMAEPEDILTRLDKDLSPKQILSGKKVIITAGPTYEPIDPVRFLGNHSSGKMGYALAKSVLKRGAQVTMILGPNALDISEKSIEIINVVSGSEMYEATKKLHDTADIAIFAAAVADYKPISVAKEKIKKASNSMSLELEKTMDIAAAMGAMKKNGQIHVGFALETEKAVEYAKAKLKKKNFDMIVMNTTKDKGAGFKHDTNKVTIFTNDNQSLAFELKSKDEVAEDIVNTLVTNYVKK